MIRTIRRLWRWLRSKVDAVYAPFEKHSELREVVLFLALIGHICLDDLWEFVPAIATLVQLFILVTLCGILVYLLRDSSNEVMG